MQAGIDTEHAASPRRRTLLLWTLAIGAVSAGLFLAMPWLDIEAARPFHVGERLFALGRQSGAGGLLRKGFQLVFLAGALASLAGLALAWTRRRHLFGLGPRKWLFLALCLAVGPGLVANVLLKDHWGRARPSQVQLFGGERAFTPPLLPARECPRNCSFVSGEASSIFALFFALALMLETRRRQLLALGLLAGGAAGLMRMAQGGHFLSDVLFAGVFMMLTTLALHWLVFDAGAWWSARRARPREPTAP